MSLVAYAESTDSEEEIETVVSNPNPTKHSEDNGIISDEDDNIFFDAHPFIESTFKLPVPKSELGSNSFQALFGKLPEPKTKGHIIEEEDDEFLRKKATPLEETKLNIRPISTNSVRITIPSLKDFDDIVDKKVRILDLSNKALGSSSLIHLLPTPKSEQNFSKQTNTDKDLEHKESSKPNLFVPDAVRSQRSAENTENIDKSFSSKKKATKPKSKISLVSVSDSDNSDSEGDFFSLTNDDKLPEVSKDEIAALISKKVFELAKTSTKFKTLTQINQPEESQVSTEEPSGSNIQNQLDKEAIHAFIGSQAKRRKMENIQIIDIDSDQVQPNKEVWLRTALASGTTYQPTGVLTDDEPAAGTRRKHQITYLAHKAKANEAELQAMWSANRQNRRQTQNKYGF